MEMEDLKKKLGERYFFEQMVPEEVVKGLVGQQPDSWRDSVVSSLTAGCVKIESVLYQAEEDEKIHLGWDLYVKDSPESPEWICYSGLTEWEDASEEGLFQAMDQLVQADGLSYFQCSFERLEGKTTEPNKEFAWPDEGISGGMR